MTIENYSIINTENNDAVPNVAPDGMFPGEVIDVFRQLMVDQRIQWNDAQWFEYLDGTKDGTVQYTSSNEFQINGADVSGIYHIGRRVKIVGSTSIYANITNVVNNANVTTVTVDQSLINENIKVYISILSSENDALPRQAIQNVVGNMLSGNSETGITVTYEESDGTIDFSIDNQTEENFTSALKTKLDGIEENANNYTYNHPSGDGNLHVPANGTTNAGKVLTASGSAGTYTWETPSTSANQVALSSTSTTDTTCYIPLVGNNSTSSQNVFIDNSQLTYNGSTGVVTSVDYTVTSDGRLKSDIEMLGSEDRFDKLAPITHEWKDKREGRFPGFIAQDVELLYPELVEKNDNGILSVNYAKMVPILVAEIQNLKKRLGDK